MWRVRVRRWMRWRVYRLLGLHVPAGTGGRLSRHIRAGGGAGRRGRVLHVARRWGPARRTAPCKNHTTFMFRRGLERRARKNLHISLCAPFFSLILQ